MATDAVRAAVLRDAARERLLRMTAGGVARALFPPLDRRLALSREGAAAFAKSFAVHAGGADVLDRIEVARGGIFQHLRDGDFCSLDRQRRVAGNGAGDLQRRSPPV